MPVGRPHTVLVCAALILALALGIRQDFGLLLLPVSQGTGWTIPAIALGFAVQQLVWGMAQPFAGALADTRGPRPVLLAGALLFAAGLGVMALGGSVLLFQLGAGVLIGLALAALGFPIIMGAVARTCPPERRSQYMGLAGAVGSFGMFALVPVGQMLLDGLGWQGTLLALAALLLLVLPLTLPLGLRPVVPAVAAPGVGEGPGLRAALDLARRHDGFWLLTTGFFVCGFHIAFIAVHLPGYVASCGLPAAVGSWALALIGLMNVFGSLAAGQLGGRFRPKHVLAAIYAARSIAILLLLLAPKTPLVLLLFAGAMGCLWLGTVPLTTGVVAGIFGPRFVSTLFGIVFLSHQVGAFLGAWAGGVAVDRLGSYDAVWWASLALAALAALVHLPIRDARLPAFQGA